MGYYRTVKSSLCASKSEIPTRKSILGEASG
jgi:hypothetical protein